MKRHEYGVNLCWVVQLSISNLVWFRISNDDCWLKALFVLLNNSSLKRGCLHIAAGRMYIDVQHQCTFYKPKFFWFVNAVFYFACSYFKKFCTVGQDSMYYPIPSFWNQVSLKLTYIAHLFAIGKKWLRVIKDTLHFLYTLCLHRKDPSFFFCELHSFFRWSLDENFNLITARIKLDSFVLFASLFRSTSFFATKTFFCFFAGFVINRILY